MNNKRTWLEKMSDFISGKGFYLVVLICVAAIALSGYYLVQGVRGGLDQTLDQPVSGSAAIVEPSAAPSVRPTSGPLTLPPPAPPKSLRLRPLRPLRRPYPRKRPHPPWPLPHWSLHGR